MLSARTCAHTPLDRIYSQLGVLTRCFSESVDQFIEVTAVAAVYAFAQIHHARAPLAAE
jgi:hypothetical protein